jgi:hypothetical protein
MSYYNTQSEKISKALPKNIPTEGGFIGNPSQAQLIDVGWLMAEIVPFMVPEGYVKVAGTRSIEVVESIPYEQWDVETIEAAHDRQVAQERESEENQAIYKIVFKMVNAKRPENMKLTVAEAKAIVNSVIK